MKVTASSLKIFYFFLFTIILASNSFAMCPGIMAPPEKMVMAEDNTQGLLIFDSKKQVETLILEPIFHGDATEFAMVLPTPSKPELKEADENLFRELEKLTAPKRASFSIGGELQSGALSSTEGINIIEEKDVGDFHATVLQADNAESLIKWLDDNQYVYTERDRENFEYYAKREGYFFVAMRVNMGKICDDQPHCEINGRLKPVEFVFSTERPMLPLRIMASDMEVMTFTIYTASSRPYYVPGAEISYSQQIGNNELSETPILKKYNIYGDWLVKNKVDFDPTKIGRDLFLEAGNKELIVSPNEEVKTVNPDLLEDNSGILVRDAKIISTEEGNEPTIKDKFSFFIKDNYKPIMIFLIGLIVIQLAILTSLIRKLRRNN